MYDFTDMGTLQSQVQYANGKEQHHQMVFFIRFAGYGTNLQQRYAEWRTKIYDQQGNLISTGTFSNNPKSGQWTEFYASGKSNHKAPIPTMRRQEPSKYYDESGTLTKTENFWKTVKVFWFLSNKLYLPSFIFYTATVYSVEPWKADPT